ncbi:MAG: hypothetical protein AB7T06_35555 [Kofleriaceae bacterium]
MRILLAVLWLLVVAGCSGPKKPAKIRFLFDVDVKLVDELEISIGGQPVTLRPPVANVNTTSGFVDFASSEIKPDARPEIRLRSVCGDRLLTDAEMERKPPNESNVVVFVLSERLMPDPAFTAAIDPGAQSVKLGSYDVPASRPERITFYGSCAFTVTVDGQTAQMPAPSPSDHSLLVAATPSTCLTAGVVVFATAGARCNREWAEKHTGQLAYWTRVYPTYPFRTIPTSRGTYNKGATCIEHGFVNRC